MLNQKAATAAAHMSAYVRMRRKELGLSMSQLARRAYVSKPYISQIENNVSKNPSIGTLMALSDALECSIQDLIGYDCVRAERYAAIETEVQHAES